MNTGLQQIGVEGAMETVARWFSRTGDLKIKWGRGTLVAADVKKRVIHIPIASCASGLSEDTLNVLRAQVYHEASHIELTDEVKLNGAKHTIWNALEDIRIEHAAATKGIGIAKAIRYYNEKLNKEWSERIADGYDNAYVEALIHMIYTADGIVPAWTPKDEVRGLIDVAKPVFDRVHGAKSTADCVKLAEEIYTLWKRDEEEQERDNQDQQDDGKGRDQGCASSDDGSQGSGGDGDSQEDMGEDGQGDDQNDSGNGGNAQETAQDAQEKKSGGDTDKSKESDTSQDSGKDAKDGGDEADKTGKASGDLDGSEAGDDSANGSGGKKGGMDDMLDTDDGNGSGDPDGDDDSESGGDDEDAGDADGKSDGGNSKGKAERAKVGESKSGATSDSGTVSRDIDEMLEDGIDNTIRSVVDDLETAMRDPGFYTSDRSADRHLEIEIRPEWFRKYQDYRDSIGNDIAALIRNAEQALMFVKRTTIQHHLKRGALDYSKLVPIAKNLSRDVYQRRKEGDDMNTAVVIAIDQSYSMCEDMDRVRLLLVALGELFNKLDIPFEIFGASTFSPSKPNEAFTRYRGVKYYHYKRFSDSWASVHPKVLGVTPVENHIDGESIEYAAAALRTRPETRKIVFSICDGIPVSGQYEDDDVFRHHLKKSCEDARSQNIEVYAIGINTCQPKYYYGEENFIGVKSGHLFSPETIRIFTETLIQGKFRRMMRRTA